MAIELSDIPFTNQADVVPASGVEEILNTGVANTLAGNDVITGTGRLRGIFNYNPTDSIFNYTSQIVMGDGNDQIIGTGFLAIENQGLISTGNGNDQIIGTGWLAAIENQGLISTGNGNDSIIANGSIYNGGTINTGDGNDSITAYGAFNREGYGVFNHKGYGSGDVALEDGNDYFYGFGQGFFSGGNGEDTLELPPGSYTIDISLFTVNFTEDSTFTDPFWPRKGIMNTSGFEKLIVGGTTYNFSSLTDGQTIFVA